VLNRLLIGAVGAAGATIVGAAGIAAADPPPMPDINSYPSAKPSEYAVADGAWYAFTAPGGMTCVLDKQSGGYGCSGPIPAAPNGANMVTGTESGSLGFATAAQPLYGAFDGAKPLTPNTRLSFRTVSCGTDGTTTACRNASDQSGFVISPAGSYTFG
jgi:hypothetical protein